MLENDDSIPGPGHGYVDESVDESVDSGLSSTKSRIRRGLVDAAGMNDEGDSFA